MALKRDEDYEKQYLSIKEINGELVASVSFSPTLGEGGTYLEGRAAKLYDSKGKVVGAVESARDITAIKRAEIEWERLITELQEALGNVKTLSRLLPICSSCRKVRDDEGYWNQIESYIRKNTEFDFTHGLCPECAEKLYGDQEWVKKRKTTESTW